MPGMRAAGNLSRNELIENAEPRTLKRVGRFPGPVSKGVEPWACPDSHSPDSMAYRQLEKFSERYDRHALNFRPRETDLVASIRLGVACVSSDAGCWHSSRSSAFSKQFAPTWLFKFVRSSRRPMITAIAPRFLIRREIVPVNKRRGRAIATFRPSGAPKVIIRG
jgi:hypothetical protein